ncbi:hypothetical protein J4Q44_G00175070 [Coregonus suidteri]|uniref:Uncharacterized protein n=1 Tax=Coregonus suidteri TaxID=861788 RepID=A0AAN8LJ84_9TELE
MGNAVVGLLYSRFCTGEAGNTAHLWAGAKQAVPCLFLLPTGQQLCQPCRVCSLPPQRAAGLARKPADGPVLCGSHHGRSKRTVVRPVSHRGHVQAAGGGAGAWPGEPDREREPEGSLRQTPGAGLQVQGIQEHLWPLSWPVQPMQPDWVYLHNHQHSVHSSQFTLHLEIICIYICGVVLGDRFPNCLSTVPCKSIHPPWRFSYFVAFQPVI